MPLIAKVGRTHFKTKSLIVIAALFLWIGVFLHLFPVWWMFTTSLKSTREVFEFPPTLWPRSPSLKAYGLFFSVFASSLKGEAAAGKISLVYPVYIYFKNSFIITGVTMLIQIPMVAIAAYSISKLITAKWNRILFLFFIGTMMIPMQISFIPNYLILRHFPFPTKIPRLPISHKPFPTYNFLNSYWAVILPSMYSAFSFILFKGFFDTIPDELINAARLDGASELGILRRIVLPLSKPILAVVAYFTFNSSWNNFIWPLIVLKERKVWPLSLILYHFQQQLFAQPPTEMDPETEKLIRAGISFSGLMAISIIQSIPVFIMFIIFREYLMTGIKLRGFK